MADASWGSGYPDCNRSKIVTLSRKDGLRIALHINIVELVGILIDLTEMMGYDVKPGQTWGFACRAIRGSDRPSNHSWGTAIDINAPSNPMGKKLVTDIPPAVRKLWKDHGFRWGGDYAGRKDAMHFEFMGTVADAQRITKQLKAFLSDGDLPSGAPPAYAYPGVAKRGDSGPPVRVWQQALNSHGGAHLTVDGDFGPATERAVRDFQRSHNPPLSVDGVAGPATWHWLING